MGWNIAGITNASSGSPFTFMVNLVRYLQGNPFCRKQGENQDLIINQVTIPVNLTHPPYRSGHLAFGHFVAAG